MASAHGNLGTRINYLRANQGPVFYRTVCSVPIRALYSTAPYSPCQSGPCILPHRMLRANQGPVFYRT
eukprot:1188911-Prorocentrum_minimum.AAC.1